MLRDKQGRAVNFKNAILIMTSNIGANLIAELSKNIKEDNREEIYKEMRDEVLKLLRQALRPEFLNRIDELIVFRSLSFEEINKIVLLQFSEIEKRLLEQELEMTLTAKAQEFLARQGYEPSFGARPLKRVMQRYVSQPLANEILKGKFREGDKIKVDLKGEEIIFSRIG